MSMWNLLLAANDASTSFSAPIAAVLPPSSNRIDNLYPDVKSILTLIPFGAGADDSTFDIRVIGWKKVNNSVGLWVPTILNKFECTLGTSVGIADYKPVDTDRFADAIANAGTIGKTPELPATVANTIARAKVDISGYGLVTVVFDMTGATNGNVLWSLERGSNDK